VKIIMASVLVLGLGSAPAFAQMSNTMSPSGSKTTKTMVTHGPKSTAVTTVSTKVMPNAEAGERGESGAKEKMEHRRAHRDEAMERRHARHHARHHAHPHHHTTMTKTTTTTKM
jgi:hypothetical protein